jgi:hypothetical protein
MIFHPFNLNIPCGFGIINLDNGREQSKKKVTINSNNTFQSINNKMDVFHSFK